MQEQRKLHSYLASESQQMGFVCAQPSTGLSNMMDRQQLQHAQCCKSRQYLTTECSNVHYVMVSKTILALSQRSKHREFLFCWNMIVLPLPSSFLPPSPLSCLRCSVVFLTVVPSRLPCDPCSTAGCYTPTLERDMGKTHQLYSTMPGEAKNGNSH